MHIQGILGFVIFIQKTTLLFYFPCIRNVVTTSFANMIASIGTILAKRVVTTFVICKLK